MRSRASTLVLVALVIAFIVTRIALLDEPWGSDDVIYFERAQELNTGQSILDKAQLPAHAVHALHRYGLLIPLVLVLGIGGFNIATYYLLPLLFGLAGFLLMIKIMAELLPRSAVVAIAVLHLVYPFEIRHSSELFTDLPAAVLALLYLYYVYKHPLNRLGFKYVIPGAILASLILFWSYLIRDNQVILLLPALAILFFRQRYRWTVAFSLVFFVGWVLVEQALYMAKGAPFGYRWELAAKGQQIYMHLLPRYTLSQYLVRSFGFIVKDIGWFGLLFFVSALACHIYWLLVSRNVLVQACLATGLFTFVVFSFYVYEFNHGRFTVMTSAHRFYQPFYYSSLLSVGMSATRLIQALRMRMSDAWLFRAAVVAPFALTISCFAIASHASPRRLLSSHGDYWATLHALDMEVDRGAQVPITLTGTHRSLRTLQLFPTTIKGRSLVCKIMTEQALLDDVSQRDIEWILIDEAYETYTMRYFEGEALEQRQRLFEELGKRLARDYQLVYQGRNLRLYRHPS